jgi:hypothetical protein
MFLIASIFVLVLSYIFKRVVHLRIMLSLRS